MRILFLTPQPIYQDRGSPIAVDLVLRVLSERGDQVDAITYHEGQDIHYDHINIHRIPNLPIRNIRAGFSWKKIVCDAFMFKKIWSVFLKNRNQYKLIHAVEEAVFFALLLKILFKVPYVYDMDSSLAQQMVEQFSFLKPVQSVLEFFEGLAVRNAEVVVPVCDALANDIAKHEPKKVIVLRDVSLLKNDIEPHQNQENLRQQFGISGQLLLYVGNLQEYQGIDLLLESFGRVLTKTQAPDLVIIGGDPSDIAKYREKVRKLRIAHKVHFLGTRPIERLADYLSQADILLSPRIKGRNTPMKIYSYLHSGKPVLATNLPTHTQVLSDETAALTDVTVAAYSEGLLQLIENKPLRTKIGENGKNLVEKEYSFEKFHKTLNQLYDWLQIQFGRDQGPPPLKDVVYSSRKAT